MYLLQSALWCKHFGAKLKYIFINAAAAVQLLNMSNSSQSHGL